MDALHREIIPARKGKASRLDSGQLVKVINTHGQQVVDTWAFNAADPTEFMSMEHTRTALTRVMVATGDVLVTNRRRPILTIVEDTSPGIHDTLLRPATATATNSLAVSGSTTIAPTTRPRPWAELNVTTARTPSPLNLFMNIPVESGGRLSFQPPVSKAGDYVLMRAEMDCLVAFSACPQDMVPINGADCVPTEAHFEILAGDTFRV